MAKRTSVTEKMFYEVFDMMDEIPASELCGYFPKVSELVKYHVKNDIRRFLPILIFFSNNPYNKEMLDDDDMEEYNKTLDYCRGIVNNLKFSKK